MSRPHSGSTILDIILGNSGAIESVGQLVSGMGRSDPIDCSCGAKVADCPFWTAVRDAFPLANRWSWDEAGRLCREHSDLRNLAETLTASTDPARTPQRYRDLDAIAEGIEAAIAKASGKPHLLDSSKEPTRGLMLLRFHPDARIIHLVRDPRRAVVSHYWRFKERGGYFEFRRKQYFRPGLAFPFMALAALSWSVGNLLGELARRIAPARVIRVRYEDLCAEPARELRRIGEAFAIPVEDVVAKVARKEPLAIGHDIGGNEIRFGREIVFNPGKGKEHTPPAWLQRLTVALCWPMMLRYGYPLKES